MISRIRYRLGMSELAGTIFQSTENAGEPTLGAQYKRLISATLHRAIIHRAIKGSRAFRRFKEGVHRFDIADEWYRYKDEAIKNIAKRWYEENNIDSLVESPL